MQTAHENESQGHRSLPGFPRAGSPIDDLQPSRLQLSLRAVIYLNKTARGCYVRYANANVNSQGSETRPKRTYFQAVERPSLFQKVFVVFNILAEMLTSKLGFR